MRSKSNQYVRWFDDLSANDVAVVGGKNASLGEMIRALKKEKVHVPGGFATTAEAYWLYVKENEIEPRLREQISNLKQNPGQLPKIGETIRQFFVESHFPEPLEEALRHSYLQLCQRYQTRRVDVAVRSSATAEDLPEASFAGQLESYLNISGDEPLLEATRKCYASLFTDRAITYREERNFDHLRIALSVGIQKMVRSDKAGAGVMFTLDTETGFPNIVRINAAWGLGEVVVQGKVNPDEYIIFKTLLETAREPILEKRLGEKEKKIIYAKSRRQVTKEITTPARDRGKFVLSDAEIRQLTRWACLIEKHYQRPMDIEWAKDGELDKIFIVQARPETVQSQKKADFLTTYRLKQKGSKLLTGLSIGQSIVAGEVHIIRSTADMGKFEEGQLLVTQMTSPDWGPILKKSKGIVTDLGGRTCHAAIVSRELGIPAIVGTGQATRILKDGDAITISCAEGDQGNVYKGMLDFAEVKVSTKNLPRTKTGVMINLASPAGAFRWWNLPCDGIGLARMEFIINDTIKVHPMALAHFDQLEDKAVRKEIQQLTSGYKDKKEYFIDHLARGIAKIGASQFPKPVIVRMSDFKTNEYAQLIGGKQFELSEPNPMLGFRGASRYYHEHYRDGFKLECQAIKRVREHFGLKNVIIMIPFCRTVEEADKVLRLLKGNGLSQGRNGLEIYVMCEIPSNVILADQFAKRFDGFSIGSNDLTQLVLGVDRDSDLLAPLFDERNEAVKRSIEQLIHLAHKDRRKVGICGEAPSNYPEFAAFLVRAGIDSISLHPDSFIEVKKRIAKAERRAR